MNGVRPTSVISKHSQGIILLAALGLAAGCQAFEKQVSLAPPSRYESLTANSQPAQSQSKATAVGGEKISTVSFFDNQDELGCNLPTINTMDRNGDIKDTGFLHLDGAVIEAGQSNMENNSAILALEASSADMTVEAFETLALQNNPTIAELVATTQKAAGYRTQVSLRANPSIGYQANQLADLGTDQHTFFISQTIVTGNKLALNRSVLDHALRAQLQSLEAQKYRVATDIRIKFFDALAAQQRVQLIQDFQSVADKGLEFAELRKQAEEGSQLEVVQAKVLKNEIDLQLRQAVARFNAAWKELAALAGTPQMPPASLQGELPANEAVMDWSTVAASIVVSSPEYQEAQARVSRARALICRHEVQPIPNLDVSLGGGYDNGTDNGLINLQIGAPIPVFNKNQGNIAAARAEYVRASREVERIENAIKARLAAAAGDFDASLAAVEQYASDILPNAQEGLDLAEIAYQAGETSYVQVLIAQRTYFETNLQYIAAQALLGQARARVDGYVLTGALDPVVDNSGDDSLRGLTYSQQ